MVVNQTIDMRKSLGLHITTIEDPFQVMDFLKSIYIANMLYTCSITAIKLSILGFYWRLFSLKARVVIYATLGMVIAWWISIVGAHPIRISETSYRTNCSIDGAVHLEL